LFRKPTAPRGNEAEFKGKEGKTECSTFTGGEMKIKGAQGNGIGTPCSSRKKRNWGKGMTALGERMKGFEEKLGG